MRTATAVVLLLLSAIGISVAYGQRAGDVVRVETPVAEDLYLAGRSVEIEAPVQGDVVAAGQSIGIRAPIEQDLIAAGETVRIDAAVGDDVRVAGRDVSLSADVADHMVAAGADVVLGQGHRVGGFAWLAGDTVRVGSTIGGDLKVAAREVVISSAVGGDAEITAERIELAPGARIAGDLIWRSENPPVIDPAAVVQGAIIARPMPAAEPVSIVAVVFAGLAAFVAVLVVGIVVYLIFPQFSEALAQKVRQKPWLALGLGLALLAATPLVVLILFVTGIGVMLGLILLVLYLIALLMGWLAGAFCTGQWALRLLGRPDAGRGLRVLAFVIAAVILSVLQWIPLLGQLLALGVLLFGLGGIAMVSSERYRRTFTES
jgi:hypothetical protein